MTPAQCLIILLATQTGERLGVPELPAVVYHESRAGNALVGDDGASFGVGHMRLSTAKDVLRKHPDLWPGKHKNEDIIIRLLKDHKWAILLVGTRVKDVGLVSYNAGVKGARLGRGKDYPQKIEQAKQEVRKCD